MLASQSRGRSCLMLVEGRSRPFSAPGGSAPMFTSGSEATEKIPMSGPFMGLLTRRRIEPSPAVCPIGKCRVISSPQTPRDGNPGGNARHKYLSPCLDMVALCSRQFFSNRHRFPHPSPAVPAPPILAVYRRVPQANGPRHGLPPTPSQLRALRVPCGKPPLPPPRINFLGWWPKTPLARLGRFAIMYARIYVQNCRQTFTPRGKYAPIRCLILPPPTPKPTPH
jgi:hypothetical protein